MMRSLDYGLDPAQFLRYVVRPSLAAIRLNSPAAEVLVLGTALTESRLRWLDQIDPKSKPGPAYGLYQMEKATHDDIWEHYLPSQPSLIAAISRLSTYAAHPPDVSELWTNCAYATAMCRAHYRRARPALPNALDALGLATYHKVHYNTMAGATVIEESVQHFNFALRVCLETK